MDLAEFAAHHQSDDLVLVCLSDLERAPGLSVPEYRRPIAEGEDLPQAVTDEDDGASLIAKPSEQREQEVDLVLRQRGGRLVECDEPRLGRDHLRDFDQLASIGRQVADIRSRR